MRTSTALLVIALLLAACAPGSDAASESDATTADAVTTTTATGPEASESGQPVPEPAEVEDVQETPRSSTAKTDLSQQVASAAADLAGRLGMGAADVELFSAENVVWRDGSLGCPEEGRAYTQALVEDGYRVILTANGQAHYYHGAGSSDPFYCENPQEPYTGGTGSVSPEA